MTFTSKCFKQFDALSYLSCFLFPISCFSIGIVNDGFGFRRRKMKLNSLDVSLPCDLLRITCCVLCVFGFCFFSRWRASEPTIRQRYALKKKDRLGGIIATVSMLG
ncbi:hypothetical protein GGR50DRAFT_665195 [Xylaria sp. CBS 124048]|nr:hypothetical protein GGR50DRAFT_665195 [Xylaria sp. CBS 124048]